MAVVLVASQEHLIDGAELPSQLVWPHRLQTTLCIMNVRGSVEGNDSFLSLSGGVFNNQHGAFAVMSLVDRFVTRCCVLQGLVKNAEGWTSATGEGGGARKGVPIELVTETCYAIHGG